MRFRGTPKVSADPFSQLASRQQFIVLNHVALGMHPFGFNGIEPGTLRRQMSPAVVTNCLVGGERLGANKQR